MGADREGGGRRKALRAAVYAACGVVVLAGCASMPDSGDLRGVESTPRQDTQVRVFAMPPPENASAPDIVQGFLEALTSDDPNYETARKYLTPEAAKTWRPESSTTVLAGGPGTTSEHSGNREDANDYSVTLTGAKVATVNAQQSYTPADGPYSQPVHLTRDGKSGQWRIDVPPPGVVMGKSDFQRNYMSVNKYYFASNVASNDEADPNAQPAVVADPIYLRERVDSMTQVVRSVLSGPTSLLRHVVRSSFPTGTALEKGAAPLTPDDRNKLTVPLNDRAARVGQDTCDEMAAQLLFTLQNLTPAVDEVELRAGNAPLCSLSEDRLQTVATHGSAQSPTYLYFIDGKHRLVRIPAGRSDTTPEPAPGALGEGDTAMRSVAVSRDEHTAAGVSLDGKALYVGSLVSGGSLGDPVLVSHGRTEDDRLTPPSWDARGDLWVADRDAADPRLLLLQKGAGDPVEVKVPGLDGRIRAVRVAADGVRIALVVEKDGKGSLLIGRIERDERSGERPAVTVLELRSATPELEEVTAMSWAGDSRLVVVGREHGGVQQMRYVQVDGSTPEAPAPAALTGVKEIAASEDERLPLVAYSEDGIVRLPSGAQWQKVTEGTAPVYPG
ncbi:LpqB family beta-propeller domain-containing protein [Streptomyces sp. S.PNR 29]|uniref:LpqB family beta-propeller domain-containing protein n=1 Tax=Streptomyces sp. S.PNR 29 TaxID=2973805 RepID=UPI0025AF7263|nr:LpqB family beta-propeller domain-containing protein [Streptomyces sp. S.PNR 29]MDN0197214.1 LpqB family beta-propeller domain-containing protein [Streptomyces sp. S.PNR 29]